MNKVIWKYPVTLGKNTLVLPTHHDVVHFGGHDNCFFVWVSMVPNETPLYNWCYDVVATGEEYEGQHVMTCIENSFVWHLIHRRISK